jgi:hypothetical protein
MNIIPNNFDKEAFLMKQFILFNVNPQEQGVLSKYLFGIHYYIQRYYFSKNVPQLCVIGLPCYVFLLVFFIYFMNLKIDLKAVELWAIVTVVSILLDVLIVQPIQIWIKWYILESGTCMETQKILDSLCARFHFIMNRHSGMIRDSKSLVHHLNPACRVARMFPWLPVSRFLLSMNDYDIPVFDGTKMSVSSIKIVSSIFSSLFLDVSSAVVVMGFVSAAVVLGTVNVAAGVLVSFSIFMAIINLVIKRSKFERLHRFNSVAKKALGVRRAANYKVVSFKRTTVLSDESAFENKLFQMDDSKFQKQYDKSQYLRYESSKSSIDTEFAIQNSFSMSEFSSLNVAMSLDSKMLDFLVTDNASILNSCVDNLRPSKVNLRFSQSNLSLSMEAKLTSNNDTSPVCSVSRKSRRYMRRNLENQQSKRLKLASMVDSSKEK